MNKVLVVVLLAVSFNIISAQADFIDALIDTGKIIKDSKEAKEKAEEEEKNAPRCPHCGELGRDTRIYRSPKDEDEFPEFRKVFWCTKCKGRQVDGVWYTREEWETKKGYTLEKRKTLRIEHLESYGWDEPTITRVMEGYIYIGDTPEVVLEAWGRPEDINRTITAYGTSEQWIYGLGWYVYFENGKVTAIQD